MSTSAHRAIDDYGVDNNFEARRARSECNKQSVYCIASIALFIVAGMVSSPGFAALVPGGELTVAMLSIGVVILVLLLCAWSGR